MFVVHILLILSCCCEKSCFFVLNVSLFKPGRPLIATQSLSTLYSGYVLASLGGRVVGFQFVLVVLRATVVRVGSMSKGYRSGGD
jgi:hypothetical protein